MKNYAECMKSYESLVKDGFTKRMAKVLWDELEDARSSGKFSAQTIQAAERLGFLPKTYTRLKCTDPELDGHAEFYANDYEYYRLWPQCNWSRIWVNDKITLKYMLFGTKFAALMPEYYYYSTPDGLRVLCDNPTDDASFAGFLALLREKKAFACKPNNGTLGEGFCKIAYDGAYHINKQTVSEEALRTFVQDNPNLIYTEFLNPNPELAAISPKVPTIRVIVLNEKGNAPYIIPSAYIRFGTEAQKGNICDTTKDDEYCIYCGLDVKSGEFYHAMACYPAIAKPIDAHPDTHAPLHGFVPNWDKILEAANGIAKHLFHLEWIGFDFCLGRDGEVKLMEINTQSGFDTVQHFKQLKSDPVVRAYFDRINREIDNLSDSERAKRNEILR